MLTSEQQTDSDELRDRHGWGDRKVATYLKLPYGQVRRDREARWPQGFTHSASERKLQSLEALGLIAPPDGMKTLIYDIETAPTKAWVWSNWQTNVIATDQDWYMLSFVYKWEGDDSIGFSGLMDNPDFKPNEPNDLWVAERLAALFDAADVLVAHNGNKFDRRKANARFILNGIDQPSPYQMVDTLLIARREFAFNSNSLNNLSSYFDLGKKTPNTGFAMWEGCMDGDPAAWEMMEEYNIQDVLLLEELYLKLRPWSGLPGKPAAPNRNHWKADGHMGCPKCGSDNIITRGTHRTGAAEYPTVKCLDCRGYSKLRQKTKGTRAVQ